MSVRGDKELTERERDKSRGQERRGEERWREKSANVNHKFSRFEFDIKNKSLVSPSTLCHCTPLQ